MVGERCKGYIVGSLQRLGGGEAFGGVCAAVVGERFRHFAQVCVENAVEAVAPCCGYAFVGVGSHRFHVGGEHCVELGMHMLVLAVCYAGVCLFRQRAIALPHIGDVEYRASGGEVGGAVHADVAFGLVLETAANGVHFGNIQRIASCTTDFIFKERGSGEAPACAGFVLVLDRG